MICYQHLLFLWDYKYHPGKKNLLKVVFGSVPLEKNITAINQLVNFEIL